MLRAHQARRASRRCLTRSRHGGPKPWCKRMAVGSHQSISAVKRMNGQVAGLLRTLKAALEARISGKVALDHDLISWMIRHSAWLIT